MPVEGVCFMPICLDGLFCYFPADTARMQLSPKGIARIVDSGSFFRTESRRISLKPTCILSMRSGLTQHLSPTRSNGLLAMVKQIKFYAIAAEAASQNTK